MIWGSVTRVFNLPSSSGISTDSVITSPYKAGVFPSFYDATTVLASSVPSPPSDKFYLDSYPSSPPSDTFYTDSTLTTFPLTHTHTPWPPPLTPLPLKYPSWSSPKWLHFNALDFLAFVFILPGIKPSQHCLPYFSSSLVVMFLEQLVWRVCLTGEGAILQCGAEIMILHI